MGSSQSVPTPSEVAVEKQIMEQLQAMRMGDRLEQQEVDRGYINIASEKSSSMAYKDDPTISASQAEEWERRLLSEPKNRLALSALMSTDVTSIVTQKVAVLPDVQTFNIKIPFEGAPITNQRRSGRCWLFATTNVHRVAIMKKHNLKDFELSQAYLFFWDKLEKANWFLEQIIDTASKDLEGRLVQELLSSPVNDGGQWDMANNLVYKYGLVPQKLYPDSYNAMDSGRMGQLITTKLREDALTLRKLAASTQMSSHESKQKLLAAKAKMLQQIHLILTLMLGPPPKPDQAFTWEFYDADGKYHSLRKTPLQLASELSSPSTVRALSGTNVNNLFSLVNDPRHKYMTHLTVDRLGNVIGGRRAITYINVDMSTMKRATVKMLKAGIPVFFGSDVGKFSNSQSGIMDTALLDYSLAFNTEIGNSSLTMSKSQRLRVGESAMTHAMVLTAVQVDEKTGKTVRWRVQNSWGDDAGEKGWFVMSDAWMDEFVYQVVVDPSFVEKEVRDCLNKEPVVLPLWDPMGALA